MSLECLLVLGGPMPTAELARIFGDVGFEVTACDSVAPAVRKLREADLNVVCIDCDLEGGVQFLTELGRHSSNRKLVAIAVCGQAFSIEEALDKGANLVLQKPVSLETARRIVHAARSLAAGEQRFQFRLPVEIPLQPSSKATCRQSKQTFSIWRRAAWASPVRGGCRWNAR